MNPWSHDDAASDVNIEPMFIGDPLNFRSLLLSIALYLVMSPALGHHSNAIYDLEQSLTVSGTVAKYEWRNPHVYLYVTTSDESGRPGEWKFEASAPALMARRGWSRNTVEVGDQITVMLSPAKIASKRIGLIRSVRMADGTELVVNSNDPRTASRELAIPPPPVAATDLAGTWLTFLHPGSLGREFVFGPTSWELTEKGATAVKSYDDSTNPAADCIAYTAPFTMIFPDVKSINFGLDVTIIRSSLDNAERIIYMDVETHEGARLSNQGHSIGRWEGETLVVDTTGFLARQNGNAFKLPSSANKHLVERFALNEDRTTLVYQFRLEDTDYLAEPLTGEALWGYSPESEFAAAGCDLENARRYLEGFDN